jgi:TonB family protein
MEMRNNLVLSAVLHISFFAAALLWSVSLLEGSGRRHDENVFFVKLSQGLHDKKDILGEARYPPLPAQPALEAVVKTDQEQERTDEAESPITQTVIDREEIHQAVVVKADNDLENPVLREISNSMVTESTDLDADVEAGQEESIEIISEQGLALYEPGLFTLLHVDGGVSLSDSEDGDGFIPEDVIDAIRNAIERNKTYPLAARKRGREGTVLVSFRINSKGSPEGLRIVQSSGYHVLDMATLDIVKKAAPFPYVDSSLEIPVVFKLFR